MSVTIWSREEDDGAGAGSGAVAARRPEVETDASRSRIAEKRKEKCMRTKAGGGGEVTEHAGGREPAHKGARSKAAGRGPRSGQPRARWQYADRDRQEPELRRGGGCPRRRRGARG